MKNVVFVLIVPVVTMISACNSSNEIFSKTQSSKTLELMSEYNSMCDLKWKNPKWVESPEFVKCQKLGDEITKIWFKNDPKNSELCNEKCEVLGKKLLGYWEKTGTWEQYDQKINNTLCPNPVLYWSYEKSTIYLTRVFDGHKLGSVNVDKMQIINNAVNESLLKFDQKILDGDDKDRTFAVEMEIKQVGPSINYRLVSVKDLSDNTYKIKDGVFTKNNQKSFVFSKCNI